jgi:hypothetical protein
MINNCLAAIESVTCLRTFLALVAAVTMQSITFVDRPALGPPAEGSRLKADMLLKLTL